MNILETKIQGKTGWLIFATKRSKSSQRCKSPIEDAEAPVEVSKDKIFSHPKCTDWGSYESNAPQLGFFHKESTNIVPVQLKSAMWLSNIFFYKATFTV
jgi:hypothetical protein